jgi:hypothetical protein
MEKEIKNKLQTIVFVGIGFELVGLVLAAIFVGQRLDEGSKGGLWTVGLIFSALVIWIIHLVILSRKFSKNPN